MAATLWRRNSSIRSSASLLLLLFLLAITATSASEINKSTSLLLPRDVAFDNSARKALQKLRRQQRDSQHQDELLTSGNVHQATMTMVGYKGGRIQDQVNQDRAFVISPFNIGYYKNASSQILGVFDGHGHQGEHVAEYALHELPKRLMKKLELLFAQDTNDAILDTLVKKALVETFVEIDESVPTNGQGGCTASVVLQLGSKLYIANAGDSVSLIAIYNTATNTTRVVYTTREDKPHLEEEYNRIVNMGGVVNIPRDPLEDSSRVMYTDPSTGYQMGLAMSRSIGDWDMVGVIAEPIVDVLDVRELKITATTTADDETCTADETCQVQDVKDIHIFAVSATDGMMDYVSPQELATSFANAFYRPDGPHPLTVAEDLILTAAKGWNLDMNGEYRDDIAIAASKVNVDDLHDTAKDTLS